MRQFCALFVCLISMLFLAACYQSNRVDPYIQDIMEKMAVFQKQTDEAIATQYANLEAMRDAVRKKDSKTGLDIMSRMLANKEIYSTTSKPVNYSQIENQFDTKQDTIVKLRQIANDAAEELKPILKFGNKPSMATFQSAIKKEFKTLLLDSESARYEFDNMIQHYFFDGDSFIYGWVLSGKVNAKNKFGAYVGYTPFVVFFRDGKVVYSKID